MIGKINGTARRLVPLHKYSKPLANYNFETTQIIAQNEERVASLEVKLSSYLKELGIPGQMRGRRIYLKGVIEDTIKKINEIRDCIRSIKIEAYKRQLNNMP